MRRVRVGGIHERANHASIRSVWWHEEGADGAQVRRDWCELGGDKALGTWTEADTLEMGGVLDAH
jgi:hypothetical protein